ncbi:Site-specific DNA methylase [Hahella chejuensis KCTC 2396]|uniref:DNA (cytosine-5-)-methyltransferase n=1 Tax=Hahella chejuensis (strain KCTC 2396) TaxID=349521 RepID=Q2SAF0_HAHCH|nr:DNA cytosine methyltransferase [Hahella chejuensis]ABC32374.1 Site-specific DNA methylase [Hahella chejuensis KCTC 2396]
MPTFVDLFCGGGFGARGAVRGGGKPLLGIDAWDLAVQTYQANFPTAEVIHSKIEDTDPILLAKKFKPDVLLTSPECTSHSIARGARPGNESSKETAIGIIPWIEAMLPRWVIVENVNRMKKWGRHNELISSIKSLNYEVSDLLLNSATFGSGQARKRMFLICNLEGISLSEADLLTGMTPQYKCAADIIDWNAEYKSAPLHKPSRAKATLERAERAIQALGRNVPFIIVYYGSDYAGGWQSLAAPLRTITTLDRFGLVTWHDDVPYLRMLQPDELKHAMGAGKEHSLPVGNRREKVKLCGNGVCAEVMEAIFRTIARTDAKKSEQAA